MSNKILKEGKMREENIPHPSWVEIDLNQFKRNIAIVREHIGKTLFCLPIKANAYGHGLVRIGQAAEQAGVDYLGVAHLQEGIKLRKAGIRIPILVLGAIHEEQILDLIDFHLEFTISSKYKGDLVAAKCRGRSERCRVHIEVDTGMQRTGVRVETAPSLYEHLQKLGCFDVVGIYSHLAKGDEPDDPLSLKQIEAFTQLCNAPPFQGAALIRHIANSGGVLHFPSAYFEMVRPSLLTFGYPGSNVPKSLQELAPCFSLKTKVSYFKVVEEGKGISYGHRFTTTKRTRIITVPIGYGDGYRRSLSNQGFVLIHGKRFPIVGSICMDQFMVDIGDESVYVGDEVVLIGKQGDAEILVEEIASLCGTIPYEVLCFFNDRLPRIYRENKDLFFSNLPDDSSDQCDEEEKKKEPKEPDGDDRCRFGGLSESEITCNNCQ
jgi:alanine racemase